MVNLLYHQHLNHMDKNTEIKFVVQPNGLTFKEVLLIDSTTIHLFSNILKGVGRNPKGDGKKKGGLKVHMLIDAVQQVGRFIKVTEAKVHDKNFLKSLEIESNCMIVFDKAYNYYYQFAQWTANGSKAPMGLSLCKGSVTRTKRTGSSSF